ncbi:MAG TPA: amidohydrolase family protein [Candidatus Eisenbacteria bacterium]|nr:amidohydrolase family protein [Candidatus Eisenbacteria bacterium]
MGAIDADTHVDESESTWKKLEGTPYEKYIPVTIMMPADEAKRAGYNPTNSRCWVVEGRLQNRAIRDEVNHPPRVFRELEDVRGRVGHMDKMGVDVQVIFPTFFIRYNTGNAEAEWALTTTYNRWIAEKCAQTNGRLRWAAVLPLLRPDKAVEELRWASEHGACAIFKRGFDLDRKITDPHFFPVYEEASALDIPLCIHTGHPLPATEWDRGFPIIYSFTTLVSSGLPKRFPKLRFGLIESGASWIPYAISQLGAVKRQSLRGQQTRLPRLFELEPELFRANRLFVTLDPIDDIESLLKFGTEDNLMIGTDYSHTDISANLSALDEVRGWVEEGRIKYAQAEKILATNARTFYGL